MRLPQLRTQRDVPTHGFTVSGLDHGVRKLRIAVVAFEDPFGHKYQPYPASNPVKIHKIIYLSLVLLVRYWHEERR